MKETKRGANISKTTLKKHTEEKGRERETNLAMQT